MPDEITPTDTRLKDRVTKIEAEILKIAKAIKRASDEIEAEWGEEIVPEGTEISGIKF